MSRKQQGAAAVAAAIAAEGYDSDEEVYATAKALEQGGEYDEDDNPLVSAVAGPMPVGSCSCLRTSRPTGIKSPLVPLSEV
jgi:hypothetical protein